jgi:two-component system sensor histidine kinase TctE
LAREPVDLIALASVVTRARVPDALARGQDLGFESEGPVTVRGDPLLLRELLTNLVENALRYCPTGSTITVRVVPDRKGASLEVEDDGPGIAPQQRQRVLDRFYRIPGSGADGSGLGLAIVKEIADRHAARLSLDSGARGVGLRVRLVFPPFEAD